MAESLQNLQRLQQLYQSYEKRFENHVVEERKYPLESLVQYNNPVEATLQQIIKKQQAQIPSLDAKPSIDELLNTLIRPRDWEVDGKRFMQTVSCLPPSRDDITNLQKLLDERLVARQARETGLCPIREELFNQCFDEITRQVTIDCPERGIILARVRDDLLKTIQNYKSLYQASLPFSLSKQLSAEEGLSKLSDKVQQLAQKKEQLEFEKQKLLNKKETIEKQIREGNYQNEQRRKGEIDYLKYQIQYLESYSKQVNPNKA